MLGNCFEEMNPWAVGLLVAVLGFVAGHSAAAEEMKPAAAAKILRLGINTADVQTMDPHYAATFNDRLAVDMLFNALIRYVPGQYPEFEADLAAEIPEPVIIGGRQTWTFNLRRGRTVQAAQRNLPGSDSFGYRYAATVRIGSRH